MKDKPEDQKLRYECRGLVKFSGITAGTHNWKSGSLLVHFDGNWKIELFYDLKPNCSILTVKLTCDTIVRVICKGSLVVHLKPLRGDNTNIHFKPVDNIFASMQAIHNVLQDIKCGKRGVEKRLKSEVGNTVTEAVSPARFGSSNIIQNGEGTNSRQTFTSVKDPLSKSRSAQSFRDQEGKENKVCKDFLQRGTDKAHQSLATRESGSFYSNTPTQPRHYGAFSNLGSAHKRKPGLLPDPVPKVPRLSDSVTYSWQKNKPSLSQNENVQTFQGFSNLGNTCYMNAILQSLFGLDSFTFDLAHANRKLYRSLPQPSLYCSLVKLLNSRKKSMPDCTRKELLRSVKLTISNTAKRFSGYQQHDAHEFLSQVLDQLKDEIINVMKSTPNSHRENAEDSCTLQEFVNPTVQNFEFEVTHNIACSECLEEVKKEEQFNDISLEIPRRRHSPSLCSIQDALDMFFRKEELEYRCEKCGCSKAEVTHKFTKLPRVLILHLKRYSYDLTATQQSKMLQSINIPKYLTLQSHCLEDTRPAYPVVLPAEYKSPQKSIVIKDDHIKEDTPRRRLDLSSSPGFRFRKLRPLPSLEADGDNIEREHTTSTPYKRIRLNSDSEKDTTKDRERTPFKPITLEDEETDPELAKALELSLKEANERTQGYTDEVDGGKEEEHNMEMAIKLSEKESANPKYDHGYEANLQGMSEEEQLRLAIEQSMKEWEDSVVTLDSASDTDIPPEVNSNKPSVCKNPDIYVKDEIIGETDVYESYPANFGNLVSPSGTKNDSSSDSDIIFCRVKDNKPNSARDQETNSSSKGQVINLEDVDHERDSELKSKYFKYENHKKELNGKDENLTADEKQQSSSADWSGDYNNYDQGYLKENVSPKVEKLQNGKTIDLAEQKRLVLQNQKSDFLPKLSEESEFKLFCDEDDIHFDDEIYLDDWPNNKENKKPTTEQSSHLPTNNSNFVDDVPKVENENGDLPYSYRLVSVVNHIGNSSVVGHYVSDVYDFQKSCWYSCDDSHVTKVTEADVRGKRERSGYIFFYLSKELYEDLGNHYAINRKMK